jgi:hypothetical protein
MSAMSNYLEDQIIKYWFQGDAGAAAKPTNLYIALFTVAPTDAGGGTEVSGGSYARVAVACTNVNWTGPTAGDGTVKNGGAINFNAPTADWGVVVAIAIFDQLAGGNMLWWGSLVHQKTINDGDAAPSFPAETLSVQIDN